MKLDSDHTCSLPPKINRAEEKEVCSQPKKKAKVTLVYSDMSIRALQLKTDFEGKGHGGIACQNDPPRLGPRSFGSKLMDLHGLKVSNFQLQI